MAKLRCEDCHALREDVVPRPHIGSLLDPDEEALLCDPCAKRAWEEWEEICLDLSDPVELFPDNAPGSDCP